MSVTPMRMRRPGSGSNSESRQSRFRLAAVILLWGPLVVAMPGFPHHSTLPFDGEHPTTISGNVTKFAWQNPHTYIYVDVKTSSGAIQHWTIESESPNLLARLGWSKDLL